MNHERRLYFSCHFETQLLIGQQNSRKAKGFKKDFVDAQTQIKAILTQPFDVPNGLKLNLSVPLILFART